MISFLLGLTRAFALIASGVAFMAAALILLASLALCMGIGYTAAIWASDRPYRKLGRGRWA